MDVQAATGDERMLRRVIALLVSFAAIAERAAGRSAPVRWLVLLILRRAETVAENFAFEMTGIPPLAVEGIAAACNDPDEALRLAARFYALAAALCTLLPHGSRLDWRRERRGMALGQAAAGSVFFSCWTRKPHDTS